MKPSLFVILAVIILGVFGFVVVKNNLALKNVAFCRQLEVPQSQLGKAFLYPYQINTIYGSGVTIAGCLKNGTLKSGMKTFINGKRTTIKGDIEPNLGKQISADDPHANEIGVLLDGLSDSDAKEMQVLVQRKSPIIFSE